MADYGITRAGFEIKPFRVLLEEKAERAQQAFGADVDLRPTSVLRKLLDLATFEDHELWKELERLYYSGFVSTAGGDALDLLGDELGAERRFLHATGTVKVKLAGGAPGRVYSLPQGALLETGSATPPVRYFRTLARLALSADAPEGTVAVEALERGPGGTVPAGTIAGVNAQYAAGHLALGAASLTVTNAAPTGGGEELEDDAAYRARLLGHPRTLWTLEAVRHRVKFTDGVRDCRLADPGGGTDVSHSIFKHFAFGQRPFGTQRLLGAPYYFDILVALAPGFQWESLGGATGVRERVEEAIREVRPISIFPNLRRASGVEVSLRAQVRVHAGHDRAAVAASVRERLERRIHALGLGRSVLYSAVLHDLVEIPGVVDVHRLHLRRCPPGFGRVNFGARRSFQDETLELAVGENLSLRPDEIAVFRVDSELLDLEVVDR